MLISEKAKKTIAKSSTTRTMVEAELMMAFNKSNMTIKRWFDNDNQLLTTPKAVQIIKKQTGLTEKQILA